MRIVFNLLWQSAHPIPLVVKVDGEYCLTHNNNLSMPGA